MSTAHHRDHAPSMGATLALTLVVGSFGAGVTGASLALLDGLSFAAAPVLTILPLAILAPIAGLVGVAFWLPVGLLLLAS